MQNKRAIENFLTPNQAAGFLNVSLSTLKKFIYSGRIKTLKTPGGHHRIHKEELLKLVKDGSRAGLADAFRDRSLLKICEAFASLLEKKYKFCRGHTSAVAGLSLKIGRGLNFSFNRLDRLYLASLLHDVGMLAIDERILNKEGRLTDKQYAIIKSHPLLGEEAVSSNKQFKGLSVIIRQHHERYDGKGYPDGLKKEQICPEARIISLAEAFSVMTAKDSYKKPLTLKEAISEVERNSASQFDPQVVGAFLELHG